MIKIVIRTTKSELIADHRLFGATPDANRIMEKNYRLSCGWKKKKIKTEDGVPVYKVESYDRLSENSRRAKRVGTKKLSKRNVVAKSNRRPRGAWGVKPRGPEIITED